MYCHTEGLFVTSVGALSLSNPGELTIVCFGSQAHHHFKIDRKLWGKFCDENCSNVGTIPCTGDVSSYNTTPTASFALVITAHKLSYKAVGTNLKDNKDDTVAPSSGAWTDREELKRYKDVAALLYEDVMRRLETERRWEITRNMKDVLHDYCDKFNTKAGNRWKTQHQRISNLKIRAGDDMSKPVLFLLFNFS